MSDSNPGPVPDQKNRDSFDVPVQKSPLFLYAALQIPLVLFMVIMIVILYKARFS